MLRCKLCNGMKHIYPLGGIAKECPLCDGVGYIVPISQREEGHITKLSVHDKMAKARASRKSKQSLDVA